MVLISSRFCPRGSELCCGADRQRSADSGQDSVLPQRGSESLCPGSVSEPQQAEGDLGLCCHAGPPDQVNIHLYIIIKCFSKEIWTPFRLFGKYIFFLHVTCFK